MIDVTLRLDRLDAIGPIATALRDQASKLRATADQLDLAAYEVLQAGGRELERMAKTDPTRVQPPVIPDVTGRITTGEAPDPVTGGVAMGDDEVDRIVQATGPQPGQSGPSPVVAAAVPAAAQAEDDDALGHHELVNL